MTERPNASDDSSIVSTLEGSAAPLRSLFNDTAETPQFLALVSPTCGPCRQGATAVRDTVAGVFQEVGFPVSLVWIPMLVTDSPTTIDRAATEFSHDGIEQFADLDRTVGRRVADSLGGSDDIAWDIYLFYGPDARWTDEPPEPTEWVHQLGGCTWAPPERYRCGDDLTDELGRVASHIVHRYEDDVQS